MDKISGYINEGDVSDVGVRLLEEDIEYLEEPYAPHKLVGLWPMVNRINIKGLSRDIPFSSNY